ncbi:Hpt domain-containing protein [bacterium]|nr:Hpt domain-containing protein [bacterium]
MYKDILVKIDIDLEDLVPGFLENRHNDIDLIKKLINEGNFSEIQRIGHSMKGSGGGYGFDEISVIGKYIEEASKEKDVNVILENIKNLADYLAAIKVEYVEE